MEDTDSISIHISDTDSISIHITDPESETELNENKDLNEEEVRNRILKYTREHSVRDMDPKTIKEDLKEEFKFIKDRHLDMYDFIMHSPDSLDEKNLKIKDNKNEIESKIEGKINENDLKNDTLLKRIKPFAFPLYNYLKHDGGASKNELERGLYKDSINEITGFYFENNKTINLGVIDIDFDHDLNENKKRLICDQILYNLSENDIVEQTGNGGLHIYCNINGFHLNKNRNTKIYTSDKFDIDLFGCIDEKSRSLIVFSGMNGIQTKIIKNANSINETILKYKFIRGSINDVVTRSMKEVLKSIKINEDYTLLDYLDGKRPNKLALNPDYTSNNKKRFILPIETIELLVDGIESPMEVHNWVRNTDYNDELDTELGLWDILPGIYAIEDIELRSKALKNLKTICSDKASSNFDRSVLEYERYLREDKLNEKHPSLYYLQEIIKKFNPEYYKEHILINSFALNPIDFNDGYLISDFARDASNNKYKSLKSAASDLSRLIRYISDGSLVYIQKNKNKLNEDNIVSFIPHKNMIIQLKQIKLFETIDEKGKIKAFNAWDALDAYRSEFSVNKVAFYSKNERVFNIFHGFKYKPINNGKSKRFIEFIKDVIADGNDMVFEYILQWIAYMIQNINKRVGTSLVIIGSQGCGKTTFTNIIAELLDWYSISNINDIRAVTGQFNAIIENKKLIILNELKNSGDERNANFDDLKSKITDSTMLINEKFLPSRVIQNICSFIFVSNHLVPIKIEKDDRRYLVLKCSDKYVKNTGYWDDLYKDIESKEFFEDLMYFFVNKEMTEIIKKTPPKTEIKEMIQKVFDSPYDEFINCFYEVFTSQDGFMGIELKQRFIGFNSNNYDGKLKFRSLQLKLAEVCDNNRIRVDGGRVRFYKLKDKYIDYYKNDDLY